MSQYQQRDNSGSLFRNEGDRKRENGPDYSGTCMVGGVEYFFDGWIKVADSGRKWMSFSFKPKQKQERPIGGKAAQGKVYQTRDDDPSDIPF